MKCNLCPRNCGADREQTIGVCGVSRKIKIARAAPHFWEEPCISGSKGSGTIFFSGCPLKCVFCQNQKISAGAFGKEIEKNELKEIINNLKDSGVHNINFVTPTHYADILADILEEDFSLPIVYNSSGYEKVETLQKLNGKIQIYLPDFKYFSKELSSRYSKAPDYPEVAKKSIIQMFNQVGKVEFDDNGLLKKGVIIRHLMLPGQLDNTFDIIDWVHENFKKGDVLFSLMSQYFPCGDLQSYPELQRKISDEEYSRAQEYMLTLGMDDGYFQDYESATEDFVPDFNLF